jgi:hypothetical protein
MSETLLVAIVGTFGTIVVALAGYVFSERRSNIERSCARARRRTPPARGTGTPEGAGLRHAA